MDLLLPVGRLTNTDMIFRKTDGLDFGKAGICTARIDHHHRRLNAPQPATKTPGANLHTPFLGVNVSLDSSLLDQSLISSVQCPQVWIVVLKVANWRIYSEKVFYHSCQRGELGPGMRRRNKNNAEDVINDMLKSSIFFGPID